MAKGTALKGEASKLLDSWDGLNKSIDAQPLHIVASLLLFEATNKRRFAYLRRLLGRYRRLRGPLEESALYGRGIVPWELESK